MRRLLHKLKMLAIGAGVLVGGLALIFVLNGFKHAGDTKVSLDTPAPSEKSVPGAPTATATIPADNRGAGAKAIDSITGLFAGQCSVRSKSVPLTGDWYDLIKNEDDCWVVAYSEPGTVTGEDSKGKFSFTGLARNPIRVRAKSGTAYFKYSLCPTKLRGKFLDWDCRPQTESAER